MNCIKISFNSLFLTCLIGLTMQLSAQKYDQNWILGYGFENADSLDQISNSIIDFSKTPVKAISRRSMLKFWLSLDASFSDKDGNLLFYSDGIRIFDSKNNLLENGDSINSGKYANSFYDYGYPTLQGGIVLPTPGKNNEYDFITYYLEQTVEYLTLPVKLLNHHIVFNSQNIGKVTSKNVPILEDKFSFSDLMSCKHANGIDWWLIIPKVQSNEYYRILLDKNGFHVIGTQALGPDYSYISDWDGQSVFSPDGTKYARYDRGSDLTVYDFDRCAGLLSNPIHVTILDQSDSFSLGCGLAISPNSRYLYVSSGLKVYQFDMNAKSFPSSMQTVATYDGFLGKFPTDFYLAQLAPDNKIYICSTSTNNYLHVIEHPDVGGIQCNVIQHAIQLPYSVGGSLPCYPNYRLGTSCMTCHDSLSIIPYQKISIFPNPAGNNLNLCLNGYKFIDGKIILHDALGRKLYQNSITLEMQEFDISTLPPAVYFYEIRDGDKLIQNGKLVKIR